MSVTVITYVYLCCEWFHLCCKVYNIFTNCCFSVCYVIAFLSY